MPDYTIKMSYEKAEEARKLYSEGVPVPALCAKFNLSDRAMRAILGGESWPDKKESSGRKNTHLTKDTFETIYALWNQHKGAIEISKIIGISVYNVRKAINAIESAEKSPSWSCKNAELTKWAHEKACVVNSDDWESAAITFSEQQADTKEKLFRQADVIRHVYDFLNNNCPFMIPGARIPDSVNYQVSQAYTLMTTLLKTLGYYEDYCKTRNIK